MIHAAHSVIYSHDADAARAFFRDVLGLPHVDAGRGWLIFALPPAELGIHPAEGPAASARHELYLMCDDIQATVADLTARGVEFTGPPADRGWGLLTSFNCPGVGELYLYEPRHPMAATPARPAPKRPTRKKTSRGAPARKTKKPAGKKTARKAPKKAARRR